MIEGLDEPLAQSGAEDEMHEHTVDVVGHLVDLEDRAVGMDRGALGMESGI